MPLLYRALELFVVNEVRKPRLSEQPGLLTNCRSQISNIKLSGNVAQDSFKTVPQIILTNADVCKTLLWYLGQCDKRQQGYRTCFPLLLVGILLLFCCRY